jgi:hypothetical protein
VGGMAQMILKQHNTTCPWGPKCCATVHTNHSHARPSLKAAKRALKKRDRQAALKGES